MVDVGVHTRGHGLHDDQHRHGRLSCEWPDCNYSSVLNGFLQRITVKVVICNNEESDKRVTILYRYTQEFGNDSSGPNDKYIYLEAEGVAALDDDHVEVDDALGVPIQFTVLGPPK